MAMTMEQYEKMDEKVNTAVETMIMSLSSLDDAFRACANDSEWKKAITDCALNIKKAAGLVGHCI